MSKYHLNPAGEPGLCKAKERCPFGDEDHHYGTKDEARVFYEENAVRILSTIERDQKAYDDIKLVLDAKAKELKNLQNAILKDTVENREQALADLERLEKENEALIDNTRNALNKIRISKKEGYKSGLLVREELEEKLPSTGPARALPSNNFETMTPAVKKLVANELANWSGITLKEAEAQIDGYKKYKKDAEKQGLVPMAQDEYVVGIFQANMLEDKTYAYIDLETSSFAPTSGEIIEIGIVVVNKDGKVVKEISERFDMQDPNVREIVGTGHVDVHKITREDIAGKRKFTDPNVQSEIGQILNDRDTVMVAHNAGFERRFLNHFLGGFRAVRDPLSSENLRAGTAAAPVQDTQIISRFLNHNTTGNRLEDFAESNGIGYIDAHSALPDAQMTHQALASFKAKLKASLVGKRPVMEASHA